MSQKKLWIAFSLVVGLSFGVLLYYGAQIYQQAPPVPEQVVDEKAPRSSREMTSRMARMFGKVSGDKRLEAFGATARTWHPTGRPITFTGRLSIS